MGTPQQVRKLTLHAVLPVNVILNEFDSGLIAGPPKAGLQAAWQAANQAYANIGNPSRSFLGPADIQALQGVSAAKVQSVLNRLRTYPPFDSHSVVIAAVNVNKLVTPQIIVDPTRAALRTNIQSGMNMDQLFDIAFTSAANPPQITPQTLGQTPNGGAMMFTSLDEDVRLHPPQQHQLQGNPQDPQCPNLDNMCFAIGGGFAFAHAFLIQTTGGASRLVLANGIHRIFSIASAGYALTPLAICNLTSIELPDPLVNLPKAMLIEDSATPPLISDFLNPAVVMNVNYFRTLRTVRFNWNSELYFTVIH